MVGQSQVTTPKDNEISFSELMRLVEEGKVESVTYRGESQVVGKFKPPYKEGAAFTSTGSRSDLYQNLMLKNGIRPDFKEAKADFKRLGS